jgi:hypothetical protein
MGSERICYRQTGHCRAAASSGALRQQCHIRCVMSSLAIKESVYSDVVICTPLSTEPWIPISIWSRGQEYAIPNECRYLTFTTLTRCCCMLSL